MSTPSNVATPQSDADQDDLTGQQKLNMWLIWILGLALLGLVGGIVYMSVESKTLPVGLTSLASLIVGGLLAFLNPVHGTKALFGGKSKNSPTPTPAPAPAPAPTPTAAPSPGSN
jgi:hypothetical protein